MSDKLKSLISVFDSIHDYALNTETQVSTFPMTVYIWVDTNQDTCKAITGQLHFEFPGSVRYIPVLPDD